LGTGGQYFGFYVFACRCAEAEEILKKILKRELESGKYEYLFEFYDLICFGYRI
jgi:hypothetical protein